MPRTMQKNPRYRDVVAEVRDFLEKRAAALMSAGVARGRIFVDPGFGFGKTLAHNLALLHSLPRIAELGYPVVAGVSRKRMLGESRPPRQRLFAGLGAAAFAVAKGAVIIRAHDVAATCDALAVARFADGVE
jgi:dihydropteroate synthase